MIDIIFAAAAAILIVTGITITHRSVTVFAHDRTVAILAGAVGIGLIAMALTTFAGLMA